MEVGAKARAGGRGLILAAAVCIVFAALRAAQEILVPIVLSLFLAVLCSPFVWWLKKKGVQDTLSVLLVVAGLLICAVAITGVLVGSMNRFVAAMPRYQERLDLLMGSLGPELERFGWSPEHAKTWIKPGAILGFAGKAIGQLAALLSNTFLVILITTFALFEVTSIPAKLRAALGQPESDLSQFRSISSEIQSYILLKTYMSVGTGLCVGLGLWLLGVDFPVLWGLFAFLLNYIPNIGSILAAILPVLLALIQFGPGRALAAGGLFLAVNTVFGNVIEPRLMGQRLGLSPLVVFLSLVVWGWLWGIVGMLFSVPLTMIVKILLEHSEQGYPIAVMLGPAPKGEPRSRPG